MTTLQDADVEDFRIDTVRGDQGEQVVRLHGALTLEVGDRLQRELRAALTSTGQRLRVDLSGVTYVDGAGASLLMTARAEVLVRGGAFAWERPSQDVRKLLELYGCPTESPCLRPTPGRASALAQIGRTTLDMSDQIKGALRFIGQFSRSIAAAARAPHTVNWGSIGRLMERAGADGVPIVALINFLIGFIMALQAAEQLRRFGANVFVANLVGLSLTRELGPLMTAIIVAGRSGAAYAAELGTMRVSEEIDALRTIGLDPQRFLVFPRVIALAAVTPILVLLADIVGCLGGWLVATSILDLTSIGAIGPGDVIGGLVKSAVFAAAITLISCQRGLETRGGAAGVGASTTSAVVTILFTLVLLDAGFTYLFELLGV